MNKTCQLCDAPKEKGSNYITTKLVGITTKLTCLRLCKKHGDGLSTVIWDLVFSYLRKTDGTNIETTET